MVRFSRIRVSTTHLASIDPIEFSKCNFILRVSVSEVDILCVCVDEAGTTNSIEETEYSLPNLFET